MVMDHGQLAVVREVDVAFDDVDAELNRGAERREGVLGTLIGVATMASQQWAVSAKPRLQALRGQPSLFFDCFSTTGAGLVWMPMNFNSVISSMAYFTPSRPSPLDLMPPYG